ncbi:hypothetical protein QVD99_003264 [Batrachochytrium dendrobatidis]|nr:hypothetical protein QVD99_003264 [Batrachochytrium dendrobatidis]
MLVTITDGTNCRILALGFNSIHFFLGFSLCYNEIDADSGKMERIDMRIQYDKPVQSISQIKPKLKEMVHEATVALSMKPDKSYVSPGFESLKKKEFSVPSFMMWIYAAVVWTILYSMAYIDKIPSTLEFVRGILGGHQPCINLLFAIFVIHAVESLVILGLGVWAELSISKVFKWYILTHVFGVFVLGPVFQLAYDRRKDLDAKDDIK